MYLFIHCKFASYASHDFFFSYTINRPSVEFPSSLGIIYEKSRFAQHMNVHWTPDRAVWVRVLAGDMERFPFDWKNR